MNERLGSGPTPKEVRMVKGARNSSIEYAKLGGDLSFEYGLCQDASLPYAAAQAIENCACGVRAVVDHLIAQNPQSGEDVTSYIKSIGCWADGTSEGIMNALDDYLGNP